MSRIGFVLLTHNKPHQILRLVNRLNSMFDFPPIVCHHDFDKCPLADGFLSANVSFVRPHVKTGWGEFSLVEAMLAGLDHLYQRPDSPDWCITLSGSCYPTRPAASVLANLDAGGYDAHFEGLDLNRNALTTEQHKVYYSRYCARKIFYPSVDKHLRPKPRYFHLPHFIARRLMPYREAGLRPFAGSQWFTVSRRAAQYLIDFQKTPDGCALERYYRSLLFSDESYFQTIVFNAPGLKVHSGNWLYLDWSEKQYHPKLLTLEDLEAIKVSPAHFARKLDLDQSAELMDALDIIIDGAIIDGAGPAGGVEVAECLAPTAC